MRPKEPDDVVKWRGPAPKCCHTCDHYNEDGFCLLFEEKPPEQFAATPNLCDQWLIEIPF